VAARLPRARVARVARAAAVAALVVSAACSQGDDGAIVLPVADAERVRELQMAVVPPVKQVSREAYVADAERSAAEVSDDDVHAQLDLYGRLGFYPRDFDLRATARTTAAYYGAFYRNDTKDITVIDPPTNELLVHELTHALQDQHFDLTRLKSTATSTDESLAIRGLIEGDAVIAERRYVLQARGFPDPSAEVAEHITPASARQASENGLAEVTGPVVVAGLVAFAYSYGAAYVAQRLDVVHDRWALGPVNELLARRGPLSTQEVLRGGVDVDPIIPTGFSALPAAVTQGFEAETVDRIGEWYTYLLLRNSSGATEAARVAAGWDGDQLILLRAKDGSSPPSKKGPSAILWTTVWDTPQLAGDFETALRILHRLAFEPGASVFAFRAEDGEAVWLEQRDNQVFFSKNYDLSGAGELAAVALSTRDERRMDIVNRTAAQPVVPCLRRDLRERAP
jgi:hypothetical protein